MKKTYTVRQAKQSEAPMIADAVMTAVGDDLCQSLAMEGHSVSDVKKMFTYLAEMEDSQYSYLNTLVAVNNNDEVMGLLVSYDGAELMQRRSHFISAAEEMLGLHFSQMKPETDASEYYLDSLAVLEPFRGQGVATALLKAGIERARNHGKRAGLLVDKDNRRARRLYESLGFKSEGERPFANVMMDHLVKE